MTMRDDPGRPTAEPPEVLTTTQARQGSSTHVTRYVLRYGLLLVIAAFVVIYLVMHR
ncbi:hypothetical protein [Methylocella sp.]|uniref:hypothetical protein n=1 Tax=Methylocella sp. TaxID=1978226 RepID=UPI0037849E0E